MGFVHFLQFVPLRLLELVEVLNVELVSALEVLAELVQGLAVLGLELSQLRLKLFLHRLQVRDVPGVALLLLVRELLQHS